MTSLQQISVKDAPQFLASKWLHHDFLVDTEELQKLFEEPFFLFSSLGVQPKGKNSIAKGQFLQVWQRYIECLKSGTIVNDSDYRFFFTAILTKDLGAIRALTLPDDKEIIIPYEPVIQMQLHRFSYSHADQKFHSQTFGPNAISWGVRVSYPQLFQYPETRVVEEALDEARFCNAALFSHIRSWLREVSIATPFIVNEKRVNVPIRLGKNCLPWINQHPGLNLLRVLQLDL